MKRSRLTEEEQARLILRGYRVCCYYACEGETEHWTSDSDTEAYYVDKRMTMNVWRLLYGG